MKIGCHLSASKGFLAMGKTAIEIGANTFQFFTRNPRGGAAKPLDQKDIDAFLAFSKENGIDVILAHAPYTLNACAKDDKIREFARLVMADDLKRMEAIPGNLYNFHPGSHVGQGIDVGIEKIADLLNELLTPDLTTTVLLETMAGKGSEVGSRFEELRAIIDKVELDRAAERRKPFPGHRIHPRQNLPSAKRWWACPLPEPSPSVPAGQEAGSDCTYRRRR